MADLSDTVRLWIAGTPKQTTPKVVLFGFGKHPAWSEHKQKFGEASGTLLRLRDKLYWDGILKHFSTWEGLPTGSRCEFDHWLIWVQPSGIVLGRIVFSTDLSSRKVPFIVAAEVLGCPLDLILRRLSVQIEEFVPRCQKLPREAVGAAFTSQQGTLESRVIGSGEPTLPMTPSLAERAVFVNAPCLDSEGVGLARLLYKVESSWSAFAPLRGGKAPKPQTGVALRLPTVPGQIVSSVLLWEEFVATHVHKDVPRLYVVPSTHDWLDLVVGEIEPNHFQCLQANRNHLGLETEVPHSTSPELQNQARSMMEAWREGKPLRTTTVQKVGVDNSAQKTTSPASPTSSAVPQPTVDPPSTRHGRTQLISLLAGSLIVGATILFLNLKRSGELPNSGNKPLDNNASGLSLRSTAPIQLEIANSILSTPFTMEMGKQDEGIDLVAKNRPKEMPLDRLRIGVTVTPPTAVNVKSTFIADRWRLSLTPLNVGPATVTVLATDQLGNASRPLTFEVKVDAKPVAPAIVATQDCELELGQPAKNVPVQITVDPRRQLAKAHLDTKVDTQEVIGVGTQFNGVSWQLMLTPHAVGTAMVTMVAIDEGSLRSAPISFKVRVNERAASPTLAPVGNQDLELGQPVKAIDLKVTVDPRWQFAKGKLDAQADKPEVVGVTTEFSGTNWQLLLTPQTVGTAKVTIAVTDQGNLRTAPISFEIKVSAKAVPPALGPVRNQDLELGQPAKAIVLKVALDPKWQLAEAKLDAKADKPEVIGVSTSFSGASWQLLLTPQAVGTCKVVIVATDEGKLSSAPVSFDVKVNAKAVVPTIGLVNNQELEVGQTTKTIPLEITVDSRWQIAKIDLEAEADKPDVLGVITEFDGTKWQLALTPLAAGTVKVRIVATDEGKLSSPPMSLVVKVGAKPAVPAIALVDNQELDLGRGAKSIPVQITLDPRWQLAKAQLDARTDKPGVVDLGTKFTDGRWQLVLTPQAEGTAKVMVQVADERGLKSAAMTFNASVHPTASAAVSAISDSKEIDEKLETLGVRFGLLDAKEAHSEGAKQTKAIDGQITRPQRDFYLAELKRLEDALSTSGRKPTISLKKLKERIYYLSNL